MKNVVNLLKKARKDMRVSFVGDRIPMDLDTIRSLRSRIRMDLLPYCEGRSMIPVDRSANCEDRIYDPNGSGIQILGIRSRDPFSGSTDMSGSEYQFHNEKTSCDNGIEPATSGMQFDPP